MIDFYVHSVLCVPAVRSPKHFGSGYLASKILDSNLKIIFCKFTKSISVLSTFGLLCLFFLRKCDNNKKAVIRNDNASN